LFYTGLHTWLVESFKADSTRLVAKPPPLPCHNLAAYGEPQGITACRQYQATTCHEMLAMNLEAIRWTFEIPSCEKFGDCNIRIASRNLDNSRDATTLSITFAALVGFIIESTTCRSEGIISPQ
jgi:hypothetical protein